MATVPRLEISFVRETDPELGRAVGIVMRTMPVSVPPYLLGPALFASWFGLAPFFVWQAALGAWTGSSAPMPAAARPADQQVPAPHFPVPDAGDPLPDNVVRLPDRRSD